MAATPLVEEEDLELFLDVPVGTFGGRSTLLLRLASGLVRGYLEQEVGPHVIDDEVELIGDGSEVLLLPELPVVDVTSVEEGTDGVLELGADYRLELGHRKREAILRRLGGSRWPRRGPVTVIYSHGYNLADLGSGDELNDAPDLPDAIRAVVLRLAARGVINPGGLAQETVGRWSGSYGFDSSRVAALSEADRSELASFRPGS